MDRLRAPLCIGGVASFASFPLHAHLPPKVTRVITMLTKIVRGTFPAAMIAVCASIYFVYFDSERRSSNDSANSSSLAAPMVAESSVPAGTIPEFPEPAASGVAVTEAVLPAVPNELKIGAPPVESLALKPPISRATDQNATSMMRELYTAARSKSLASSASAGETDVPVPQVSDLPETPSNVVANTQYGNTRVNDYWIGLERARATTPSAPVPGSSVIVNPYDESGASTLFSTATTTAQHVIVNPYHQSDASTGQVQQVVSNELSPSGATGSPTISRPIFVEPDSVAQGSRPPVQKPTTVLELPMAANLVPAEPLPIEREPASFSATEVHSNLATSARTEARSPSVRVLPPLGDHVRQRLTEHWEYGGSLARRNAVQLAKQEFFSGLTLLAEHADQHEPGSDRLRALREGFLALEELRDFAASSELKQADLMVIVQNHETPLIREGHFQTDSHSQARQAYLMYAKERIRTALETQPLAAELLYSCGKLHLATYEYNRSTDNVDLNCARTLFECARLSDPTHAKSCNELAVIQAKDRNWTMAKSLLQQAVGRQPQFVEAWQNLTKVHRQLGEVELAELSAAQVAFLSEENSTGSAVRMVSNSEFASTAAAMDGNMELGDQQPRANDQGSAAPMRFGAHTNSDR